VKLLFSLIILLLPSLTWAAYISAVGMQDQSNPEATGFTTGSKSGTGGGLILGGHPLFPLEVELGALYFTRSWEDNTNNKANIETTQVLQVPLTFHLFIIPHLAIGVGGYYSWGQGSIAQTGQVPNSNLSYTNYGIKSEDYGAVGDVQLRFHLYHTFFLRLEYRYTQSLGNLALTPGNNFTYRDSQFLAGFTMIFGGHSPKVSN